MNSDRIQDCRWSGNRTDCQTQRPRWLWVLVTLVGLSAPGSAQRQSHDRFTETFGGASVSASGQLVHDASGGTVQTGVSIVGAVIMTAPEDCLVVGQTGSNGVAELWRFSNGGPTLVSTHTAAQADWANVVFDPTQNMLYVFDATAHRILWAPWVSGLALPPSWVTFADSSELPPLIDPSLLRFHAVPDASAPTGTFLSLNILPDYHYYYEVTIRGAPGAITHEVFEGPTGDFPTSTPVHLAEATVVEGAISVLVEGVPGASIEVVRTSAGTVVGTGTIDANTGSAWVSLIEPLVIGNWYVARSVGDPILPDFASLCVRRYGSPGSTLLSSGIEMGTIPTPRDARIGYDDFCGYLPLRSAFTVGAPVSVSGIGLAGLGFRNSAGQDPVVLIPEGYLLSAPEVVYWPIEGFLDESGRGGMTLSLPIPNEPSLVGQVALFQFGLSDGTQLVLSQIVGVEIMMP